MHNIIKKYTRNIIYAHIKLTSIVILIILSMNLNINNLYSNNIFSEDSGTHEEYERFIDSLKNLQDNKIGNSYLSVHGRRNLIIGCSPVVFCGISCGDEVLDKYDYDIIAFGGTRDGEIMEWFQKLDPRCTYNNIIIWGSVNDIMSGASNNSVDFSDEYKEVIKAVIDEATKHLNPNVGKIYYVNPKMMIEGLDTQIPQKNGDRINYYGYSYTFNTLAERIIDYVKTFNVIPIEVEFPTTKDNSDWYLHYTNPDVFISIFEKVDKMNSNVIKKSN